jgi:hypothetical protein
MDIENGKEFFLVLNGGADDVTSVDWDGNVGFQTKEDAIESAKDLAEVGGAFTLFRCIPVDTVERGPVRVKPIKPITPRKP